MEGRGGRVGVQVHECGTRGVAMMPTELRPVVSIGHGPDIQPIALQHARTLAGTVRKAAKRFPPEEAALASQFRRAADSAALNLAEGNSRRTNREFRQFIHTARSSLKEVETIIELAADGDLLEGDLLTILRAQCDEALRTVWGLLRTINERIERGEVERRQTRLLDPDPPS